MTHQQIRMLISGQLGALVQATGDAGKVRDAFEEIVGQGDAFWRAMAMLCSSTTVDQIGRAVVQDAISDSGNRVYRTI